MMKWVLLRACETSVGNQITSTECQLTSALILEKSEIPVRWKNYSAATWLAQRVRRAEYVVASTPEKARNSLAK